MPSLRIALLEDDKDQADVISVWLTAVGHACTRFLDGESFKSGVRQGDFDLLILDWVLPGIGGDRILEWVRRDLQWNVPVIFVTQRDSEADIVYALERGADDYMIKPIKPLEMLARISALGRRAYPEPDADGALSFGVFRFHPPSRSVLRDGASVELTQKEFDLALFLFQNPGRLVSRAQLLAEVWGHSVALNTRTVDTHISRVRIKLGLVPENGWRLSAVYQHGYRLERLDDAHGAGDAAPGRGLG